MVRRLLAAAMIAVFVAAGLAACTPGASSARVGELVASWSQTDADGAWVLDAPGLTLMTTDAERAQWLGSLPPDIAHHADILAVDLSTHSLVAGAYYRCTEYSTISADAADEGFLLHFAVETDEPDVLCAWAPRVLDAWAIPHAVTGGGAPVAVTSSAVADAAPSIDVGAQPW